MIEEIYQQLQCFLRVVNLHWPIEILCRVRPENLEVEISRIIEKWENWGLVLGVTLVFGLEMGIEGLSCND